MLGRERLYNNLSKARDSSVVQIVNSHGVECTYDDFFR
jgi:hypothetical protein